MSKLTSKTYTIRLSLETQKSLMDKSDKTGLTPTEIIREATDRQLRQPTLTTLIRQLEIRMLRRNFEMNSIIVGLSSEQRAEAIKLCNEKFGQEILK